MVHTLNELKPGVKVDKQTVQIDHSILFLRYTALEHNEKMRTSQPILPLR